MTLRKVPKHHSFRHWYIACQPKNETAFDQFSSRGGRTPKLFTVTKTRVSFFLPVSNDTLHAYETLQHPGKIVLDSDLATTFIVWQVISTSLFIASFLWELSDMTFLASNSSQIKFWHYCWLDERVYVFLVRKEFLCLRSKDHGQLLLLHPLTTSCLSLF